MRSMFHLIERHNINGKKTNVNFHKVISDMKDICDPPETILNKLDGTSSDTHSHPWDHDDHIEHDDDRKFTSCQLFVRKEIKNKSIMIMIDYSEMVVMMVMIVLTGTFADCKKVTIIMTIVIVVLKSVLVKMKMLNI